MKETFEGFQIESSKVERDLPLFDGCAHMSTSLFPDIEMKGESF